MGSKDIAYRVSRAKRTQRTCAAPFSHMTRIGSHARDSPSTALSRPSPLPSRKPVHMGLASLCISNRAHFISRTLRCVYGSGGLAIRSSPSSSSTFANSSWRHSSPLLLPRLRPLPITASRGHPIARTLSWAAKFNLRRPSSAPPNDPDANEEAAKEAVLEAIKGRQQTDLMLRCESPSIVTWLFRKRAQIHFDIGTVLDADGTPSDHTLMFPSSLGVPITRGSASLCILNGASHQ